MPPFSLSAQIQRTLDDGKSIKAPHEEIRLPSDGLQLHMCTTKATLKKKTSLKNSEKLIPLSGAEHILSVLKHLDSWSKKLSRPFLFLPAFSGKSATAQ